MQPTHKRMPRSRNESPYVSPLPIACDWPIYPPVELDRTVTGDQNTQGRTRRFRRIHQRNTAAYSPAKAANATMVVPRSDDTGTDPTRTATVQTAEKERQMQRRRRGKRREGEKLWEKEKAHDERSKPKVTSAPQRVWVCFLSVLALLYVCSSMD